jgi:hypothetical protein
MLEQARRWGIPDDGYRDDAIYAADPADLESVIHAVDEVSEAELVHWLCGPEAATVPSSEYVAVSALMMAADLARIRLARNEAS